MADSDVQRLAVLIEANTKSYENAMARILKQTNATTARTSSILKTLGLQFDSLGSAVRSVAGAFGIGFGIAGLVSLGKNINDVVQEAGALVKTAEKIGITTDQLQEYTYAAKLADVETDTLTSSIEQFGKRLGDAQKGTGDLYKVLTDNGIALKDASGNFRSVNDLLLDYADLVQRAGSAQDKLYLATTAFGKAGADMIPLLNGGRRALKESADEAQRLGLVINNDLLKDADRIGDEWDKFTLRLGTSWKRFVLGVVSGIDKINEKKGSPGFLSGMFSFSPSGSPLATPLFGEAGAAINAPGGAAGSGIGSDARIPLTPQVKIRTQADEDAIKAGEQAQKKIDDTTKSLQKQLGALGLTNREQAVYNALTDAGITANSKAAPAITQMAEQLYDQTMQLQRSAEAAQLFGDTLFNALDAIIVQGKDAGEVIRDLILQLIMAEAKAQFMNAISPPGVSQQMGPLSLLGAFLPGLFGFAAGGPTLGKRPIIVGEKRPEIFVPSTSGRVVPNTTGSGMGGPSRIAVDVTPSEYFDVRVRQISGDVAIKTSVATVQANDKIRERQRQLAG